MAFSLPELPYAKDALAPYLSAETLSFHHGKHHNAYVNKLNELTTGTPFESMDLVALIQSIEDVPADKRKITFNQAAQHYNHSFYWNCLKPGGGGEPTGAVADAINKNFGSFQAFKDAFTKECLGHFGSGWGWLVKEADGTLKITSTHDAGTPVGTKGHTPLLTCDVWEHAYYVDYRNDRAKYVGQFWSLVNWDFVAKNLG